MKNLKTNRSVGLYVGLTVLSKLAPAITLAILIGKLFSGVGKLANFSLGGSSMFYGMGADALLGGAGGMDSLFGRYVAGSMRDALIKFFMPFIIVEILCLAYVVYKIVLFYGVCKDIDAICQKHGIGGLSLPYPLVWLLSGVTLNIFCVIWSKITGKRLKDASEMYQRPIKGTPGSHLLFAIFESLPVYLSLLFLLIVKAGRPGVGFYVFYLFLYFISFILSFVGISNMAGFIRDVNVLAQAYNGQAGAVPYGQEAAPQGQPSFAPQSAAQQDDDLTMPVQEWAPNAANAWKPDTPAGGMMEGCKGIYEGAQIPVEGEIVIGRDEMSCNIVIKTPEVSRRHCGVRYNPDGTYTVTDYSSNGVYYKNGQAFPKNAPVICGAGTIIVIARSGNEFILK